MLLVKESGITQITNFDSRILLNRLKHMVNFTGSVVLSVLNY